MTGKQRILLTLQHKQPDRVPVCPILSGITRKLTGATYKEWALNADVCAKSLLAAASQFEQDCIVTLIDLSLEADAWGIELTFSENAAPQPDIHKRVLQSEQDYNKILPVHFLDSKRMQMHIDVCKKLVREKGDTLPIIAFVFAPLGVLSMLRGQQELFLDLYDCPQKVKEAVQNITQTLCAFTEALCDTGIDAVMFDTLFASASVMSANMWCEFEGEAVRKLSQVVKNKNKKVMIHNCGNKPYFDEMISYMRPDAISFLHVPFGCTDFNMCKQKYGDALTLIGAVPPTAVVLESDEEWRTRCENNVNDMAQGGGFILATGCEYPSDAPLTKARIMVDVAKNAKYNT